MLFKSAMLIALVFLMATLAFGVLSQNPRSNQDAARATEQNLPRSESDSLKAKTLDDEATPVVDLSSSKNASASTHRLLKNNRYDNQGFVQSEVDPRVASVVREPPEDITDFPTDKSDIIVEGTVTDSAAFLSNDRGAVYSEITVQVSDVITATPVRNLKSGDSIVTERFGGRVKYPNGKIVRYGIIGQGSPAKRKKYLFFLSRTEQGDYNLLTAYELMNNNKVQALDGSRITHPRRGNWAFDKHNDQDYQSFRKAVEQAVKDPPRVNTTRRSHS